MTVRRPFAWVALLLLGNSLRAQEVAWHREYGVARQEAADKARPLVLTFTSQNCRWCVALDATTYRDPTITKLIADKFVPLKVEAEVYPNLVSALGIQGFPTIVVASASGRIVEVHRGYIEPVPFAELLGRALTKMPGKTAVTSTESPDKKTPEVKEPVAAKEAPKASAPATKTSVTKEATPIVKETPPTTGDSEPKADAPIKREVPPATTVAAQKETPPAAAVPEKKETTPIVKETPSAPTSTAQKKTPSTTDVPKKKVDAPAPEKKKEAVVKEVDPTPVPPSYPAPPESVSASSDPIVKSKSSDASTAPPAVTPPAAASKTATEPAWMADDFRRAAEAVGRSEFPRAVALLRNLVKDDIQWPTQARAAGLLREIERQAATRLTPIKEAESKGEVTEAIRLAREVVSRYDGTEAASEALAMVSTLSARLEDKDRDRMMQAQAIMKQASEDFRAGQWLPCLLRCEDLQARFSDLPESVQAGEIIAKIKSNPSSLQRICDGLPEVAGQVYLTMAEVKIKQGEPQQAMFFLERVLQAFPSSKHAEMAQVRLSQIQGPPPVNSLDERKD